MLPTSGPGLVVRACVANGFQCFFVHPSLSLTLPRTTSDEPEWNEKYSEEDVPQQDGTPPSDENRRDSPKTDSILHGRMTVVPKKVQSSSDRTRE